MGDGLTLYRIGGGILTILLVVAAVSDLRSRRIPNRLVLVVALFGLAYAAGVGRSPTSLVQWGAALAIGFAIWIPFYALGMLGAGDVKLFAAAASWFAVTGVLRAALLSALIGGTLSLVFMLWTRSSRVTLVRVGTWLSLMKVGQLRPPEISTTTPQMPYGVAMALGLTLAWWAPELLKLQ